MADLLDAQILAKQQQLASTKSQASLLTGLAPKGAKAKYRVPLAPAGNRYQAIPEGVQFSEPKFEGEIAPPSDVRYANLGKIPGQFIQSPSQKGIVKETRDVTREQRIAYKGGLAGEVDHIIPVWLGGSGSPENLRVLTTPQHLGVVTKAQAAIMALYRNPELAKKHLGRTLDLPEARMWAVRAIDMKPEDVSGIYTGPKGYEKGYIVARSDEDAVKQAAAALKQWQGPPKVTFKSWWDELLHKGEVAGKLGAAGAVTGGLTAGPLGAGVGLAAGLGLGLGATDPEKTAQTVARAMPDNPFGEFGKAAVSGLYLGHVPVAQEGYKGESSYTSQGARMLGQLGGSLPWYISASHGVEKAMGALGYKIPVLGKLAGTGASSGKVSVATVKFMNALKEAGVFAGVGQMSKLEDNESRIKRLMGDMLLGGTIGVVGLPAAGTKGVKYASELVTKSAEVAVAGYVISALQGADYKEATYNALLLASIHGIGGLKIDGAELDSMAARAALDYRSKFGGLPKPEELGIFPPPPPPGETSAIFAMPREDFDAYLGKLREHFVDNTVLPDRRSIFQEADTPEAARQIMENIVIANRQIARVGDGNPDAALEDIRSLAQRKGEGRPTSIPEGMQTAWDAYERMAEAGHVTHDTYTPNDMQYASLFRKPLEFVTRGTSTEVSRENARSVRDAIDNGAKVGDTVLITRRDDPEFVNFIKAKAKEFPEDAERLRNPEESLQVSIKQNGAYRPLGFVPGDESVTRQQMEHPPNYVPVDPEANRHTMTAMLRDTGSPVVTGKIVAIEKAVAKSGQPVVRVRVEPADWDATQTLKLHYDLSKIDRARESALTAKKLAASGSLVDAIGKILDEAGVKEKSGSMLTALNGSLQELHNAFRTGDQAVIKEYFNNLGVNQSDTQAAYFAENADTLQMKHMMRVLQVAHANDSLSGMGTDVGPGLATYQSIMGDGSIYRSLGPEERKAFEDVRLVPPAKKEEAKLFAKKYVAKSKKAAPKAAVKEPENIPEPRSTQVVEEGGEKVTRENLPDGRYWIEITPTSDRLRYASDISPKESKPPIGNEDAWRKFIKKGHDVSLLYRGADNAHPLMARIDGDIMEVPKAEAHIKMPFEEDFLPSTAPQDMEPPEGPPARKVPKDTIPPPQDAEPSDAELGPTKYPVPPSPKPGRQFFGPEAPSAVPEVPESMKKAAPVAPESVKKALPKQAAEESSSLLPEPLRPLASGKRFSDTAMQRGTGAELPKTRPITGAKKTAPLTKAEKRAMEAPGRKAQVEKIKTLEKSEDVIPFEEGEDSGMQEAAFDRPVGDIETPALNVARHLIDMLESKHGIRVELGEGTKKGKANLMVDIIRDGGRREDVADAIGEMLGIERVDSVAEMMGEDASTNRIIDDIEAMLPAHFDTTANASGVMSEDMKKALNSAPIKKFRDKVLDTLANKPVDSEAFLFNFALDRALKAVFETERPGTYGPWKPPYEGSWQLKPEKLLKGAGKLSQKAGGTKKPGMQSKYFAQARAVVERVGEKNRGKTQETAKRIAAMKELHDMGVAYDRKAPTDELIDLAAQSRLESYSQGPGKSAEEGAASAGEGSTREKQLSEMAQELRGFGLLGDESLQDVTEINDAMRNTLGIEAAGEGSVEKAWDALKKALPARPKEHVVEEPIRGGAGTIKHKIKTAGVEVLPEKAAPDVYAEHRLSDVAKALGKDIPPKDLALAEDAVRVVMQMAEKYNEVAFGKSSYVRPQFSNEVIVPAVIDIFKLPEAEKRAIFEKAKEDAKRQLAKPAKKPEFLGSVKKKPLIPEAPPEPAKEAPKPETKKGTLTMRTGRKLATEEAGKNTFWLQQNTKTGSFWAKLALKGHKVEHLMVKGGGYANKVRIDGKEYSYSDATKAFRK